MVDYPEIDLSTLSPEEFGELVFYWRCAERGCSRAFPHSRVAARSLKAQCLLVQSSDGTFSLTLHGERAMRKRMQEAV